MQHTRAIIILSIFLIALSLKGQVELKLSVQNESISGTDYLFDIYLERTSPATNGNIFLGNADFILAFNESMFQNPNLDKEPISSPGLCTLLPANQTPINILFTQDFYFNNTVATIEDGYLIINLNGPTPGDTSTLYNFIARIDTQPLTHRLGRFKISNITNPNAQANLRWKTVGSGLKTMVFSFDSIAPFNSHQINLITDKNTCPDELQLNENPIPGGMHQAAINLFVSGQITSSSNISFRAGQSVQLLPGFSINASSTLQISIGGCQ